MMRTHTADVNQCGRLRYTLRSKTDNGGLPAPYVFVRTAMLNRKAPGPAGYRSFAVIVLHRARRGLKAFIGKSRVSTLTRNLIFY